MQPLGTLTTGLKLGSLLGCILLAACASQPKIDDAAAASAAAASCQSAGYPQDRSLASANLLDLISEGKEHYRRQEYGLAEQSFRQATELVSFGQKGGSRVATLEAWFGLAASYDQLKRFDLADQIYEHIRAEYGPSPAYYNNYGYSLELRGEPAKARQQFEAAARLAPGCGIARNNLEALSVN